MREIMAVHDWASNAELIHDVARLGDPPFLDGTVLDVTYGEGTFWKEHMPARLITSDLYKPGADYRWDYLHLPLRDGAFTVVVFDPPYKLQGTDQSPEHSYRYGVDRKMNREERLADIVAGVVECYRVCSRYVLIKCHDQVEGGKMRWQTDLIRDALEPLGAIKVARFDMHGGVRPQPSGWSAQPATGKRKTFDSDVLAQEYVDKCGGGKVVNLNRRQITPRNNATQLLIYRKRAA